MHGDAERIGGDARNRVQIFDGIVERLPLDQGFVDVRPIRKRGAPVAETLIEDRR